MKKYDLILVGLYVLAIALVGGAFLGFGKWSQKKRGVTAELCDRIRQSEVRTVVLNDTHCWIYLQRTSGEERVTIERGQLVSGRIKNIRLSNDTLYIGPLEESGNYLRLNVPDFVKVDTLSVSNITFK